MSRLKEMAMNYAVPQASSMLSLAEAYGGKVLTKQEMQDRAYSHCGRWLLDQQLKDRGVFEQAGTMATVADWECLEAENPVLHDELAPLAASMLEGAGIKMPFTLKLAEVHSLDEARARREAAAQAQVMQHGEEQTTAQL